MLCALIGVAAIGALPGGDVTASEVLERVRAATGFAHLCEAADGYVEEGAAAITEPPAALRFWFDASGRFVETIQDDLQQAWIFDGRDLFQVDATGVPSKLALGDRETRLCEAWLNSGYWLAADGPFTIKVDPARTTRQAVALRLELKQGQLTAGVMVDRATWLPMQSDNGLASSRDATVLEDYRQACGLTRPSRRRATGRGTSTLITITSLRPATAAERAACQPPREVEDTDFATDVESALTVKRAPSGHLLVPVKVNGEAVGWFVFDTGAGQTCIDLALAERLGLDQQRGVQAVGVGGATAASLCRARTFTIGPMTMENPRLIGLDLQPLSKSMGEGIAGVCGYDVFRRSVVVVDMRDAKIELYPPGDFVLERAQWQELIVYGKHPCVRCSFDAGRPEPATGIFKLDTGAAADTVSFHAPAVRQLHILDGRTTSDTVLGGVGGTSPAKVGAIEFFELAAHRFHRPRVNFSLATGGAFVDEYTTGNIGGKFMEPFRIAFDYGNDRIAFVPRDAADER